MKGYELKIKEIADEKENNDKHIIGKIGGNPTYLPDEYEDIVDYFVMEIYNTEVIKGNEDVIGWQLYQDTEFGGIITEVIEIKKGAQLYKENMVPTRRWINEYLIYCEEKTWEDDIPEDEIWEEQLISMIYGNPGKDIFDECEFSELEYLGIIYEDLCPYCDFSFGNEYIILAKSKDGNIIVL